MSATIWIAIAAIIVPSINSWAQFWLKERSEKKKALATANPATNQPNITIPRGTSELAFFHRNRRILAITDWVANSLAVYLIMSVLLRTLPLNFPSVVSSLVALVLAILVNTVT